MTKAAQLGTPAAMARGSSPPTIDTVFVIPAFQAEATVGTVVGQLRELTPQIPIVVVDDGSTDATFERARQAGAQVVSHGRNMGKGRALRTGLLHAAQAGARCAVTLDADGQHPASEAYRLASHAATERALVLGVRSLRAARAPRANQFSNALSNAFLSGFSGVRLYDTQCGLRRYPIAETLQSSAGADGFAFESELVLIAALEGWPIVQLPVRVHYPPGEERTTHFHNVKDPARIVATVVSTLARHWIGR